MAISGDAWPDDLRLSDLEPRFICKACGKRGADVRPDLNWNRTATVMMGYRNLEQWRHDEPSAARWTLVKIGLKAKGK